MVDIYRLKDFDIQIGSQNRIVKKSAAAKIEHATATVTAAETKAAEIIADAKRVFEEEKKRGYQDGQRSAELEAAQRLVEEQQVLDKSLAGLQTEIAELVHSLVKTIVSDLDDENMTVKLTRQALAKMRRQKRVQLHVPKKLVAKLKKEIKNLISEFPEIELIDVVADPSLLPPNIILESPLGRVACSLEDGLTNLLRVLVDAAGGKK